jgi:hypothetical protein
VVDCVERFGSTTRVRSNGARLHPESQGLTVAVFRQTTSRLDDPQLHSHVVISSKVQTADGRWLALDARSLKGFQRSLGGLYQSVLRAELTARYGVVFGEIVKGQAEIAGMPEGLLEEFSKRSVQVERAYQRLLADFYSQPARVVESVVCNPAAWDGYDPVTVGLLELGDLVDVTLPGGDSSRGTVERIEWDFGDTVSLRLGLDRYDPAGYGNATWFILGTSALGGTALLAAF